MESPQPASNPEPSAPPVEASLDGKKEGQKKTRRRRITKANFADEIERQMLEQGPEMLRKKWVALGVALDKGERWAVELIARQFEGDRGPGGVNIVSQTLNVNGGDQATGTRSLESIVRKLELKDSFKVLPAPTPIRTGSDVLDAEEV